MNRSRLLLFLLALPLMLHAGDKRFNDAHFKPLPPLRAAGSEQGLSAAYAGMDGGRLVVAGGSNFPDVPAAQGGAKKMYAETYRLVGDHWQAAGRLSEAAAYGASVSTPQGVLLLGGCDSLGRPTAHVALLAEQGRAERSLAPLPLPLKELAAAAGSDGWVYVAGGLSTEGPSVQAFRARLVDLLAGRAAWQALPPYGAAASEGRVQPCAVVQNGALGPVFYLFGGYSPLTKTCFDDGVAYDPRTGHWHHTAPIRPVANREQGPVEALVGAAAATTGTAGVVFFGGVNKAVFERALQQPEAGYLEHPAAWYRFRDRLLFYQTITDAWSEGFVCPRLARAGAAAVSLPGTTGRTHWAIVGGEEKPGVRSADTTDVELTYSAHFGALNWAVLIAYLAGMLGLGFYFMRRQKGGDDFFKGGGRIPWWAAGISIFATMLSAITYMSIPAKAYVTDWTYYPMQICILLVSFPVIKYYLPFFRRLNVTTAYEYLERRFNYVARAMASVLFIVFMVARMALVLFLPSLAMTAVTGIDIYTCIVLMAVITIVYCTMGGMEAVVWGDVVQGIILVGGALLAAGYLIAGTSGGSGGFFDLAMANDKFRLFDWSFDYRNACFWVVILGGLANNLISYTSDQTVIQRYLTTKDERSAARGILTNGLMSVFVTIAFFTIGTGLYTFFKTHPAAMDMTMQKSDAIFPFFMMSQLPVGVAGLLIAAVFAATMSTIASNINSISTAFTIDLYRKFVPASAQKSTLRVARAAGIVSGVIGMLIAMIMATTDIQSLLDYFNTILGLLSGGIGGLFLMGIFFPRIGARAALCGFVAGTAVVVWMNFCTAVNFLLFGFVSVAVSVAVALALSVVWPQRGEQAGLTWRTLRR